MKYYGAIIKWDFSKSPSIKRGWGNGYVLVPKDSILSGIHYDDVILNHTAIKEIGDIKVLIKNNVYDLPRVFNYDIVHFGITWSAPFHELRIGDAEWLGEKPNEVDMMDMWCFGFDTAHYSDTIKTCPKEFVIEQTLLLKENLSKLEIELTKKL